MARPDADFWNHPDTDVWTIKLPAPEDVRWWHRRPRWWASFRIHLWKMKMRLHGYRGSFEDG